MTLNQFAVSYLTTALFRSTNRINQRSIFLFNYTHEFLVTSPLSITTNINKGQYWHPKIVPITRINYHQFFLTRPNINLTILEKFLEGSNKNFFSSQLLPNESRMPKQYFLTERIFTTVKSVRINKRKALILLSYYRYFSKWLLVQVVKPSWIRVSLTSSQQTYLVQPMAASQDVCKPVCSCISSHCLIQKHSRNQRHIFYL